MFCTFIWLAPWRRKVFVSCIRSCH